MAYESSEHIPATPARWDNLGVKRVDGGQRMQPTQDGDFAFPAPPKQTKALGFNEVLDRLSSLSNTDLPEADAMGRRLAEVGQPNFLLRLATGKGNLAQRYAAVKALDYSHADFTPAVTDTLLACIDDLRPVAVAAIHALANHQVDGVDDELLDCLNLKNGRVAGAALSALHKLGRVDVTPFVPQFLQSDDPGRLAAASRVVGKGDFHQFAPLLIETIQRIRPQATVVDTQSNPFLPAMLALIGALDELRHQPAIPLLSELAEFHLGVRGRSLDALEHLGVEDTEEIAIRAYFHRPIGNVAKIVEPLLNIRRLPTLTEPLLPGTNVVGTAQFVDANYAVIQLELQMYAHLQVFEYRWIKTHDLRQFESALSVPQHFVVTKIEPESGLIEVSRKQTYENPFHQFAATHSVGSQVPAKVDQVYRDAIFVTLASEVMGMLRLQDLAVTDADPIRSYTKGQQLNVQITGVDQHQQRFHLRQA